jgi:PERQ amino acid-rich with GYF domain-containing protein
MLLTFPVEPPHKDEMLEIIAESVYANSSTLDGKRFANNFYMRRKEDAIDRVASNGKSTAAKVTSLADSESPTEWASMIKFSMLKGLAFFQS